MKYSGIITDHVPQHKDSTLLQECFILIFIASSRYTKLDSNSIVRLKFYGSIAVRCTLYMSFSWICRLFWNVTLTCCTCCSKRHMYISHQLYILHPTHSNQYINTLRHFVVCIKNCDSFVLQWQIHFVLFAKTCRPNTRTGTPSLHNLKTFANFTRFHQIYKPSKQSSYFSVLLEWLIVASSIFKYLFTNKLFIQH